MKNLIVVILSLMFLSCSFAQDMRGNSYNSRNFGNPPGRQIQNTQPPIQQPTRQYNSFVVIPLYHTSPALIAAIMGGEVIWDDTGGGQNNNNSYGGNNSYGRSSSYGGNNSYNGNNNNSRGNSRSSSRNNRSY